MFDNPATRGELAKLYNTEQSFLSFEGQQMQGTAKIMEKINSLTFQSIAHIVTSLDMIATLYVRWRHPGQRYGPVED